MLLIKKFIGYLLAPETVILVFLAYGLLKHVLSGRSKLTGWRWMFLGAFCFYLFSTAPLPDLLLRQLESQYKPFDGWQNAKEIQYIAVLSGSARCTFNVPPTSQLDDSSVLRVVEGIRLFQIFSGRPILIMSGGGRARYRGTDGCFRSLFGGASGKTYHGY